MDTHSRMAGLAAAVGLLLVLAMGCSSKSIQTASDSSTEPGVSKEPRVSEQDLLGKSPSAPGQGRQSKDIAVAKVEPSDAARRHAEDIRRERGGTALAGREDGFFGFDSWDISDEGKHPLVGGAP